MQGDQPRTPAGSAPGQRNRGWLARNSANAAQASMNAVQRATVESVEQDTRRSTSRAVPNFASAGANREGAESFADPPGFGNTTFASDQTHLPNPPGFGLHDEMDVESVDQRNFDAEVRQESKSPPPHWLENAKNRLSTIEKQQRAKFEEVSQAETYGSNDTERRVRGLPVAGSARASRRSRASTKSGQYNSDEVLEEAMDKHSAIIANKQAKIDSLLAQREHDMTSIIESITHENSIENPHAVPTFKLKLENLHHIPDSSEQRLQQKLGIAHETLSRDGNDTANANSGAGVRANLDGGAPVDDAEGLHYAQPVDRLRQIEAMSGSYNNTNNVNNNFQRQATSGESPLLRTSFRGNRRSVGSPSKSPEPKELVTTSADRSAYIVRNPVIVASPQKETSEQTVFIDPSSDPGFQRSAERLMKDASQAAGTYRTEPEQSEERLMTYEFDGLLPTSPSPLYQSMNLDPMVIVSQDDTRREMSRLSMCYQVVRDMVGVEKQKYEKKLSDVQALLVESVEDKKLLSGHVNQLIGEKAMLEFQLWHATQQIEQQRAQFEELLIHKEHLLAQRDFELRSMQRNLNATNTDLASMMASGALDRTQLHVETPTTTPGLKPINSVNSILDPNAVPARTKVQIKSTPARAKAEVQAESSGSVQGAASAKHVTIAPQIHSLHSEGGAPSDSASFVADGADVPFARVQMPLMNVRQQQQQQQQQQPVARINPLEEEEDVTRRWADGAYVHPTQVHGDLPALTAKDGLGRPALPALTATPKITPKVSAVAAVAYPKVGVGVQAPQACALPNCPIPTVTNQLPTAATAPAPDPKVVVRRPQSVPTEPQTKNVPTVRPPAPNLFQLLKSQPKVTNHAPGMYVPLAASVDVDRGPSEARPIASSVQYAATAADIAGVGSPSSDDLQLNAKYVRSQAAGIVSPSSENLRLVKAPFGTTSIANANSGLQPANSTVSMHRLQSLGSFLGSLSSNDADAIGALAARRPMTPMRSMAGDGADQYVQQSLGSMSSNDAVFSSSSEVDMAYVHHLQSNPSNPTLAGYAAERSRLSDFPPLASSSANPNPFAPSSGQITGGGGFFNLMQQASGSDLAPTPEMTPGTYARIHRLDSFNEPGDVSGGQAAVQVTAAQGLHTSNNSDDEKMVPRNPSTTLRATLLEQQLLGPRDSQKHQEIQPVGDSAKSATAEKVDPTPEFARQTTATALPNPNVSYWSKRSASSSGIGSPTGSPSKWKTVKDWFRSPKSSRQGSPEKGQSAGGTGQPPVIKFSLKQAAVEQGNSQAGHSKPDASQAADSGRQDFSSSDPDVW